MAPPVTLDPIVLLIINVKATYGLQDIQISVIINTVWEIILLLEDASIYET